MKFFTLFFSNFRLVPQIGANSKFEIRAFFGGHSLKRQFDNEEKEEKNLKLTNLPECLIH
jgi:hypothetical protein